MEIASYLLANAYSSFAPMANLAATLNNGQEVPSALTSGIFIIFWLAFIVFMFLTMWKVYAKAGQPGWAAIIPIYNMIVMLRIVGRPLWWIILMFIPIVNIIVSLVLANDMSKVFGKGIGFTLGLIFLPFIFYPILAFGKATYLPTQPGTPVPPPPTSSNPEPASTPITF